MKVLVVAEAANPEWTSVPLLGWSLAKALARQTDVHVVTQHRNRAAIERQGWVEGRDFTAIDSDPRAQPWVKIANWLEKRGGALAGWTTFQALSALMYPHFEAMVWECFGEDIRRGKYDLVHRITPVSPTSVSSLAPLCARAGVPFLIGPLNGGVPWPKGFGEARRREKEWLSYVRGAYKLLPGHRKMLETTSRILVGSRFTQSDVGADFQHKCVYMPENAVDPERFSRPPQTRFELPLRAIFLGRLVPYKGPDMLLEAAEPWLRAGSMTLDIVGHGPMFEQLQAWIADHHLEQAVRMHGFVKHDRVQEILGKAHILSFPSIREFGGGVVLEAMMLGVVPVVADYAGPGELVDDAVGYKVSIGSRAEIIARFSTVLGDLCRDPTPLVARSAAARARVIERFTWDVKAAQLLEVYRETLTWPA